MPEREAARSHRGKARDRVGGALALTGTAHAALGGGRSHVEQALSPRGKALPRGEIPTIPRPPPDPAAGPRRPRAESARVPRGGARGPRGGRHSPPEATPLHDGR